MWMGVKTTLIWSEPNVYTPDPVRTFNPIASVKWPSGRLRNIFRNGQVNRAHPGAVGITDYNAELVSVGQYENAAGIGDPALQALPVNFSALHIDSADPDTPVSRGNYWSCAKSRAHR
jgi:hypothetical protein